MSSAADYVSALVAERMKWEMATALRVLGGVMIVWLWAAGGRLRMAEESPDAASMDSASAWCGARCAAERHVQLHGDRAAHHVSDPAGARLAEPSRTDTADLTPSLIFTLALATAFVGPRFGDFRGLHNTTAAPRPCSSSPRSSIGAGNLARSSPIASRGPPRRARAADPGVSSADAGGTR